MNKKFVIGKVVVPIVIALIGVIGGFIGGAGYVLQQSIQQNSAISVQINNVLNRDLDSNNSINTSVNLKESTDNLIDAYESTKDQSNQQAKELEELQSKYSELENDYQKSESENQRLNIENEKLKAFLLQDNRYAENVDDLVVVKVTSDKLNSLYKVESNGYEVVDAIRDLYGDVHSVSYKFRPRKVAFVTYRLRKQYDTFDANIATTSETGNNVKMSVEVYVDDEGEPRKRIDDVTRDTNVEQLGPVVITGADKMTIKVITTEGDDYYSYLYITDDSLSVVQ